MPVNDHAPPPSISCMSDAVAFLLEWTLLVSNRAQMETCFCLYKVIPRCAGLLV